MTREYRFVLSNGEGERPHETLLTCLDDEGALLLADRLSSQCSVEVWDQDRFVGKADFAAPTASAAPAEPRPRQKRFWTGAWRRGLEQRGD
jgi:hypothetical protein